MFSKQVCVTSPQGLSNSLSIQFALKVQECNSKVYLGFQGKSEAIVGNVDLMVLKLISLSAKTGDEVIIEAEGPDEQEVVHDLAELLQD